MSGKQQHCRTDGGSSEDGGHRHCESNGDAGPSARLDPHQTAQDRDWDDRHPFADPQPPIINPIFSASNASASISPTIRPS